MTATGDRAPPRHARVWIRPALRATVRASDPAHGADVERWLERGLPAVARRRDAATAAGDVALAIALPLARGRTRVALAAPARAVERVAPPLALAEALASTPAGWRPPLGALDAEARRAGLVLRVYGSLAWQHLTGEAYVRDGSDVDLVVPGAAPGERARSLALLARWEPHATPRLDGELDLGGGRGVAWREVLAGPERILVKSGSGVTLEPLPCAIPPLGLATPGGEGARGRTTSRTVNRAALDALREELETDPKPGLVSSSSSGAHGDMDARTFGASLAALDGSFADAADAGARGAPFAALRAIGVHAEERMLRATRGVNTHRGAIFALGLLSAAAGRLAAAGRTWSGGALGEAVREGWGRDVLRHAPAAGSHGEAARREHGVPGAREEAALGFPHVFAVGLPAFEASLHRGAGRVDAAVQALFALMERLPDTNLLHRGGGVGLALARRAAAEFLRSGGVHRRGWRAHARAIDRALVARNLSPGGSADLLAATLFVWRCQEERGSDEGGGARGAL